MRIDIRDLPFDGRELHFTEAHPELHKALQEITQNNPIELKLTLFPVDKGADLHGEIRTAIPLPCSYCINTLNIPVCEKFHEIILIGHKNKVVADGPDVHPSDDLEVMFVDEPSVDITPLLQEIVQSNAPIQPKCLEKGGPPGSPHCIADWDVDKYLEESDVKTNPFHVLENLKKKLK